VITALADMLGTLSDEAPARRVKVTLGGRTVLDLTDAKELSKLVYRIRVSSEQLPRKEGAGIELEADSDGPLFFTVTASGTQRLDRTEASGTVLRMERRFESLDGKPLKGKLKVGQVFAVRLLIDAGNSQSYVLVEDRRPGGCEFADERIDRTDRIRPANIEFRDDRFCLFAGSLPAGRHEVVYFLRAETAGVSHVLPGELYPMYEYGLRGESGSDVLEIVP